MRIRKFYGCVASIGLLLLAGLLTSCVTRVIQEDPSHSRLIVTRSAGDVTLSWESRPDMSYTILYNNSLSATTNWRILPGHDRLRGTGRTLVYHDKVNENEKRFYRLQSFPAISLSP